VNNLSDERRSMYVVSSKGFKDEKNLFPS